MKKLTVPVLVVCLAVLVSGCAGWRKVTREFTKEVVKNIETDKENVRELLPKWSFVSGEIRKGLGSRYGLLPGEVQEAHDHLDKLAEKKEWTDAELGEALGCWYLITGELVLHILKRFAPEGLALLTSLLT